MIDDLLGELAPIIGEDKASKLWLIYQTETDLDRRREVEAIIHSLAAKHLEQTYDNDKILLPPPRQEDDTSGYLLGTVYYGDDPRFDFFLPEDQLLLHCGVFGATGSGKTNLGFLFLKQLLEKGRPFMLFDWKRSYRSVLSAEWGCGKRITIFTVGREVVPFSFDPLDPPPGTDRDIWEAKVVDVLSHSHFLGHGVRYLLKLALTTGEDHNLAGLLSALMRMKAVGRKRQWLDSAIRAVGDLTMNHIGKVFCSNSNTKIHKLLNENIVFELDALAEDAKTFFIEVIMAYIHQFRLSQSERSSTPKHFLIIEEAHHILTKRREYQENETIMDVIFREIRQLSESMTVLTQNISMISKPALGNTGTTILMRSKLADDVRTGGDCILLDPKQRNYLGQLQVGWAIVKTPTVNSPFLIKVPHIEIPDGNIGDESLRERMESYSSKRDDIPADADLKELIPPIRAHDKKESEKIEEISKEELEFMKDIMVHSISGVAERYKRLNLSGSKGQRTKEGLLSRNLVQENSVSHGKGSIKMLRITESGKEALVSSGIDASTLKFSQRLGGPEHRYWKEKMANELEEKGFQVEKEHQTPNGKFVDIVAKKGDKRAAVEIETGKSNALDNIRKDIQSEFDSVIVVTTSEKERKRLLDELNKRT